MKRILLIEDDAAVNNILCESLRKAGYFCTQAFSAIEGLLYLERDPFALVIADLKASSLEGRELLARIRASQPVPVLALSANSSFSGRFALQSVNPGEYRNSSAEVQELITKVYVQLRRVSRQDKGYGQPSLHYRNLRLDPVAYQATIDGKEVPLTLQEFKILELLLSNPNHVFSKQDIYNYAWDDFYTGEDKTVNVHVSNIRRKIRAFTDHDYIRTVWGCGFQFRK